MPEEDSYLPIEDYAAIGDGRVLALVSRGGSIDWMCAPELDAPSVFGALLDPERGGRCTLEPVGQFTSRRAYVERTNVLETVFETDTGSFRVTDAVTIDSSLAVPWRELVRVVEGISGRVPVRWRVRPRFDYGRSPASFRSRRDGAFSAREGELKLVARSWDMGEPVVRSGELNGEFAVEEGESALLVLQASTGQTLPLAERRLVLARLQETIHGWRAWVGRHTYQGPWQAEVERSLLAIRLLADGRSGAIAAAGTTSLPEVLGGQRNYDYRFGWVRDLSFTLDALLAVGMDEQTHASLDWLLASTERTHPRIDPVYSLNGGVVRSQEDLPLAGYRGTGPVRLGNNAGAQLQLGGWGDLIETVWTYVRHGHSISPEAGERLGDMGQLLCQIWTREDAGLWELGQRAHYTTSKIGCWVALDRLLELSAGGHVPDRHAAHWRRQRDEIARFIDSRLYSAARGSYLMEAQGKLDCGTLLAARRGYGDPRGARLRGTIEAIRAELHAEGPLFYRYSGMQEEENAFLACSFWLVEALALSGQLDAAGELMGDAVSLGNDVGLLSEEMEPGSRALRGNFPQALTHLSLISAAAILASCQDGGSAPEIHAVRSGASG